MKKKTMVKQDITKIMQKLDKIEDRIKTVEIHAEYTKKAIEGNGVPGLVQKVSQNSKWINMVTGALILLTTLVSYGLIKFV